MIRRLALTLGMGVTITIAPSSMTARMSGSMGVRAAGIIAASNAESHGSHRSGYIVASS